MVHLGRRQMLMRGRVLPIPQSLEGGTPEIPALSAALKLELSGALSAWVESHLPKCREVKKMGWCICSFFVCERKVVLVAIPWDAQGN